ncbi:hypothetical protein [Bifidobacterium breve]
MKDGAYDENERMTPVPPEEHSSRRTLAMARDIANVNRYEASIYDDENEMIITIPPEQYSIGVAA